MRILPSVLDFLFPKSERILQLEMLSPDKLISALPKAELSGGEKGFIALFDYSHPLVKEIVWEVKYHGNRTLAEKLGTILYDTVIGELQEQSLFYNWRNAILVPIPISDKRRFERGWNQTELICLAVKSHDSGRKFKYLPRQLSKIFHTESQTQTSGRAQRRSNLKGSMKVLNPLSVKGQCVVVIDDVVTTGSTFAEARRALKEAGAKKIMCVAVAH